MLTSRCELLLRKAVHCMQRVARDCLPTLYTRRSATMSCSPKKLRCRPEHARRPSMGKGRRRSLLKSTRRRKPVALDSKARRHVLGRLDTQCTRACLGTRALLGMRTRLNTKAHLATQRTPIVKLLPRTLNRI